MKVRKRRLSLFLTLTVVIAVFANDIRMTEAQEQPDEILEEVVSEEVWSENSTEEERLPGKAEPEGEMQSCGPLSADESAKEVKPDEALSADGPAKEVEADESLLTDEPAKEVKPDEALSTDELAKEAEPDESLSADGPAKEVQPDEPSEDEPVRELLPEGLAPASGPVNGTLPGESSSAEEADLKELPLVIGPLKEPTEEEELSGDSLPGKVPLKGLPCENILPEVMQKAASATTYVPADSVILMDEVVGKIQDGSRLDYEDLELPAGEEVVIQYRPKFNICCLNSNCVNTVYQYTPIMYGEMSTEVSNPGIVGECEFSDGVWTSDDIMYGSACLCLNSTAVRPGSTMVKALFYTRYDIYLGYGKRCPLCRFRLGSNDYRGIWFDCDVRTNIRVYADYILKYDANAGNDTVYGMPSTVEERGYTVSRAIEVTDTEPVREGYSFLGWAEAEDGWREEYKGGDQIELEWKEGAAVEKTLYAVWDKKVPTIITGKPEEEPDLTVIKRICRLDGVTEIASVETGEEYNYVVTVTNNTNREVRNIQISETLNTSLVQLLNHPTNYENGIWKIDFLKSGETAVLTLHVRAVSAVKVYENTVYVAAEEREISPGPDDVRSATITITEPPNLIIRKEADKQQAAAGELITYEITVKNPAVAANALDVTIIDQLPEELEWMSAVLIADGGTLDPSDDRKLSLERNPEDGIYKAGNLVAGESVVLTMTAVATKADMTITNVAIAYKSDSPEVKDSASIIIGKPPIVEEKPEQKPGEESKPDSDTKEPTYESVESEHAIPEGTETVSVQRTVPYVSRLPEQMQREPHTVSRETGAQGADDQNTVSAEEFEKPFKKPVRAEDLPLPLAGREHLCCILHFVIMLLALLTELFYMRSMKKHQKEIFDVRWKMEEIPDMGRR